MKRGDAIGCVSPERARWPTVRRGRRFTTGIEMSLSGSVVLTRQRQEPFHGGGDVIFVTIKKHFVPLGSRGVHREPELLQPRGHPS